jgi:hypothetical protein
LRFGDWIGVHIDREEYRRRWKFFEDFCKDLSYTLALEIGFPFLDDDRKMGALSPEVSAVRTLFDPVFSAPQTPETRLEDHMSNKSSDPKLGLVALIAIVVSSMIGSGVDSLPQNMAETLCPGARGHRLASKRYWHVLHR